MIKKTTPRHKKHRAKKIKSSAKKECSCEEEEELSEEEHAMAMAMVPGIIENGDQRELENRGIILINEPISKPTLSAATKRLLVLHFDPDYTDDIQIIINSPGGYCDAGWAFIDTMDFVKNKVITICMGEICSMATSIFINGEERIMAPNSLAMIHQFSNESGGTYSDLVANRKMEDLVMEMDLKHLIKCSKYSNEKQIREHILKETDHWLSPTEMKKHGLCDKVFRPRRRRKKK